MKPSTRKRLYRFKKIVKKEGKRLRSSSLLGEFKIFLMRGSVLDLAVGVIIGGAFQKIVSSIVNDVFMPVLALVTKLINKQGIDFADWFIALDGKHYDTLKAAKEAGAITINYGNLLTNTIDFLIMAAVIFLLVKGLNTLSSFGKKTEAAAETVSHCCPFCKMPVQESALRCPHCTSHIEKESDEQKETTST